MYKKVIQVPLVRTIFQQVMLPVSAKPIACELSTLSLTLAVWFEVDADDIMTSARSFGVFMDGDAGIPQHGQHIGTVMDGSYGVHVYWL